MRGKQRSLPTGASFLSKSLAGTANVIVGFKGSMIRIIEIFIPLSNALFVIDSNGL
jgi:hypothetical protein